MTKGMYYPVWTPAAALALVLFSGPGFARAATIVVTVDTSALSGTSGRFEFDLFDGDGVTNNTVTISNLVTNGTLGAVDCSTGCTGGPPFALNDSIGFGMLLQDLTLGSTFSFTVNYTNNLGGSPADRFALFLLNPGTNFTLLNTSLDSPFSDTLALLTLDGTANIQTADVGVSVSAVPEPGSALLLTTAFLPPLLFRKRLLSFIS